ncbi:MAG: rod shape-determining protein MreC [Anaerolineae bacterium]|nr:MAG: rod shape-determining protein MreC [Anaerolineae bacterium]
MIRIPHNYPRAANVRLLILLAVSVGLLVLNQLGVLNSVKALVLRPILPLQSGMASVTYGIQTVVNTARELSTMRQQNENLQELVGRLTIENVRLKDVEVENARLRRLLRFRQANPGLDVRGGQIIGRIVGRDPTVLRYLQIDLGSDHGIAPGMPVVSDVGLVGRITDVNATSARVLLITDPNSSVNAIIQGSRLIGVINGVDAGYPHLNFLPQDATISPGDIVLTSGLAGNFPKGLVIGQVVDAVRHDYEMFQYAEVRPTVDFNRLETVLVITNFRPIDSITLPSDEGN